MFPRHAKPSNAAFTLLELSLVLAVLSLIIGGIIQLVTQNVRRNAMAEVNRKMDVIEAALLDFSRRNGYLPCPADSSVAITGQYFGVQAIPSSTGITGASTTACINTGAVYNNYSDLASDSGTYATQAATFYDAAHTVAGDVPIKTLGLSDEYMFDPWGGRFFYAIDQRMVMPSAFSTNPVITASTTVGPISITDGAATPNYKVQATSGAGGAIAVVMSYGPDGHGAFQYGGGKRKAVGNSNVNTLTNCHCTSAAAASTSYAFTTFVQAPATSTSSSDPANFDDIIRYYVRGSFLNAADVSGR